MQSGNVRDVTGDVGMKLMMRKDLMIRERMRKWTSTLVDPQTRELVQCYCYRTTESGYDLMHAG